MHAQQTKVVWFSQRTGCSEEESKRWLVEAKWRLEIAIRLRRAELERNRNKLFSRGSP